MKVVQRRFNSLLNFDAMTLGNHEFDDGVKGLVPFLRNQVEDLFATVGHFPPKPDCALCRLQH